MLYENNCTQLVTVSTVYLNMQDQKPFIPWVFKISFFSLLGGTAMTWFMCNSCRNSAMDYLHVSAFSSIVWFTMWIGNELMEDYFEKKISWVDFPVLRLIIGIVTTIAYSASVILSLLWIWGTLFHFDFGDYYTIVIISLVVNFIVSLILHSRAFLSNWKQSAIQAEKLQKETIQAQYESLKNQVNPHFLFNSLNALTNLVYEDPDKATRFIKQLSEVYRYVLDTREKEVVTLDEELKFISAYIYLQEIRFGSNLKIDVRLAGVNGSVAPLALQLLVENAIKHNIVSTDNPLTINIYESEGFLVVENNLQRKSLLEENLSGLGLENIQKRYSFLTSKKVVIEEGNSRFSVRVPLLEINDA
jgi:sensor histidine kinase YesM